RRPLSVKEDDVRSNDLLRRLLQTPFQPFRIILSDGTRYDIRHPDQVEPLRSTVDVVTDAPDKGSVLGDFIVSVSYFHIVRLEPILTAAPLQTTNGAP